MAATLDFSLRRDRLYEQVVAQIEQLIFKEALRPGDKLPSERILAERLGVSRAVIRETTRVLSARGLVEVNPGSGTYIREPSVNNAAAPIGLYLKLRQAANAFQNLCEIRLTLEVDIAGLAAERASDEDMAAMQAAIGASTVHVQDAEEFVQHDLAFHSALARATHNDLYGVLLTPITDLLLDFRLTAYHYDPQGAIEGSLTHHRHILEQVQERHVEGARQAMREHLAQAQSLFEAAIRQTEGK